MDQMRGYYFKVLRGQGPDAPLGKLDYMIEGAMIGGFALVAVPAEYRVTGIKTFMVDYDGVCLPEGPGTRFSQDRKNMELYNPDKTWSPDICQLVTYFSLEPAPFQSMMLTSFQGFWRSSN